jgi:hypothetical protein
LRLDRHGAGGAGLPTWRDVRLALPALRIWLAAGAAVFTSVLVEQHIDARIAASSWRPTARGEPSNSWTFAFQPPCAQPGRYALCLGQPHHVANICHVCYYASGDLHRDFEAPLNIVSW